MARKSTGPKLDKKLKNSGVIVEADFKYMYQNPDGDLGFSVEHNQRIINDTIKATRKKEAELRKAYMNKVEERVDAGVSFLRALARGKYATMTSHDAALKYFGRTELARLRGEEIKHELMAKMGILQKLVN